MSENELLGQVETFMVLTELLWRLNYQTGTK